MIASGSQRQKQLQCLWLRNSGIWIFLVFCYLASANDGMTESSVPLIWGSREIIVGVRADAEPFSYFEKGKENELILPGYTGYMVEICRRVLAEVVSSESFARYSIVAKKVTAGDRFSSLDNGRVDLLCGPDSITLSRLQRHNVSHPLFLSGITYVQVRKLPQKAHCKGVIGLLRDTTADSDGLQMLADSDELGRFDSPLQEYLETLQGIASNASTNTPQAIESFFHEISQAAESKSDSINSIQPEGATSGKHQQSSIFTKECPENTGGYSSGPIIHYDDHTAGINAFCLGDLLYYLGDTDIVNRKLRNYLGCEFVPRSETMTREAYGVYFRRPSGYSLRSQRDSMLYSEFNNVLLKKMESENILLYEFKQEFKNLKPSPELKSFFESFRYATD